MAIVFRLLRMNAGAVNLLGTHKQILLSRATSSGVHQDYRPYLTLRTFSSDGPEVGGGHSENEDEGVLPKARDDYLEKYNPRHNKMNSWKNWGQRQDGPGGGGGHFDDEDEGVLPKALDDYLEAYKNKPPRIPRNKMKSWCKLHGGRFRTHVIMRPQRLFPEPWVCETFVNDRVAGVIHKTRASATSKLRSVDASVNKMYTHLLANKRFQPYVPYGH